MFATFVLIYCWKAARLQVRAAAIVAMTLFALMTPAAAQKGVGGVPIAATGPRFDFSAGYTYLAMPVTSAYSANMNGLDATAGVDFSRHWGATADASYVRASNVLALGHGSYVMTFLVGPIFYPFERHNFRVSVRALGGAGLVDSIVPATGGTYLHGWVTRPSFAAGGGVEHSFYGPFGAGVNMDYLRTAFVNSTDVVQGQNNLRLTVSLLFHIRDRD